MAGGVRQLPFPQNRLGPVVLKAMRRPSLSFFFTTISFLRYRAPTFSIRLLP
jgi:hypothetical protein